MSSNEPAPSPDSSPDLTWLYDRLVWHSYAPWGGPQEVLRRDRAGGPVSRVAVRSVELVTPSWRDTYERQYDCHYKDPLTGQWLAWGAAQWADLPTEPSSALAELLAGYPQGSIPVWGWDHAPELLKALSPCGGDEDWVAYVPAGYSEVPYWLERLSDGDGLKQIALIDGARILFSAHA